MVVPFPPGGATDTVARILAKSMSEELGQSIVIENRAGAGGIIGAEAVAKAAPDGYTILASTAGVHVVNPAIYAKLPYDPVTSWAPVSLVILAPMTITVRTESRFKTLRELAAYAKNHPGKLTYASPGSGTSPHQAGEALKHAAGIDILHVPYKGAGPATTDFLGGRIDMMLSYVGSAYPSMRDGKLRILAVGSRERMPLLPGVPTMGEELGQPDYVSDTWTGIVAPAGTPPAVIQRLNRAAAFALEANRAQLLASGYQVLGGTPEAMRQRLEQEHRTITPLLAKIMNRN
nr:MULTISPECIES: tripartite tricarboxylate transporter substrate binding protein [Achromobacter]